ncbi:MAG TPA: hypothetical protein VEX87_19910 [Skermanella sp.]|jgi:ElaB/YqjD/DUF883 family membrane-anchored ribosome-binding protein|nr:hypothetical protein [Skermanella sp.]
MTGSTGTPSQGTKPTDVVARSVTSRPDPAAAATTETNRPSAEKILETGAEEVGAPTPAMNSPVDPATATGGAGVSGSGSGYGSRSGYGSGVRPGSAADQYSRSSDYSRSSEQTREFAERVRQNAVRARNQVWNQGRRGIGTAESFVRENPAATLIGALAAGLVLGALLGRSSGQRTSSRLPDYDYDDEDAYRRDYYYD